MTHQSIKIHKTYEGYLKEFLNIKSLNPTRSIFSLCLNFYYIILKFPRIVFNISTKNISDFLCRSSTVQYLRVLGLLSSVLRTIKHATVIIRSAFNAVRLCFCVRLFAWVLRNALLPGEWRHMFIGWATPKEQSWPWQHNGRATDTWKPQIQILWYFGSESGNQLPFFSRPLRMPVHTFHRLVSNRIEPNQYQSNGSPELPT